MICKLVDALKFIFALFVVTIHCDSLAGVNADVKYYVTQSVLRLAVPFFFVASGFFLGRKINQNFVAIDSTYKNYIKRLLIPLAFFTLVNIVLESIKMFPYASGPMIFREILKHVLFYPWGALWFVQACIIGALLLYPFVKREKIHLAIFVSAVLYLWALLCNNYFFVVQGTAFEPYIQVYMNLCISARNGLFVGFVYLAIGFYIAKKQMNISNLLVIGAFVLYLLEIILLKNKAFLDDSALYVSQLIVVPIIFVKSLNMTLKISNQFSLMLRNFSVGIYLLHRPIISFFDILGVDYIPRTFVVSVVCVGICYLVYKENGIARKILF